MEIVQHEKGKRTEELVNLVDELYNEIRPEYKSFEVDIFVDTKKAMSFLNDEGFPCLFGEMGIYNLRGELHIIFVEKEMEWIFNKGLQRHAVAHELTHMDDGRDILVYSTLAEEIAEIKDGRRSKIPPPLTFEDMVLELYFELRAEERMLNKGFSDECYDALIKTLESSLEWYPYVIMGNYFINMERLPAEKKIELYGEYEKAFHKVFSEDKDIWKGRESVIKEIVDERVYRDYKSLAEFLVSPLEGR